MQEKAILEWMFNHEWITPNDAIACSGCYKLATIIGNLKKKGYKIQDEWTSGTNRYGSRVRFKRYKLLEE